MNSKQYWVYNAPTPLMSLQMHSWVYNAAMPLMSLKTQNTSRVGPIGSDFEMIIFKYGDRYWW